MLDLRACLPKALQTATVSPVGAGLSGAGVFRVTSEDQTWILKLARPEDSDQQWEARLRLLRLAADAGLAPRVVHVDRERRAVVSEFVGDGTFFPYYFRDTRAALTELGGALRRLHALPLDSLHLGSRNPLGVLETIWQGPLKDVPVPQWLRHTCEAIRSEAAPEPLREVVSHNDLNPTNLAYTGERLVFLDWDTAGSNDPYFDLASAALFLDLDDASCCHLLSAYQETVVNTLPPGFRYHRRLVAALAGSVFLRLACSQGHRGNGLQQRTSLPDFYADLQAGRSNIASADGQWAFGTALLSQA